MTAAGVSLTSASWLVSRVEALTGEGVAMPVPGPGIETFSATTCSFCRGGCGLKLRLIDGLPVGTRGNTAHLVNEGRLCASAQAIIRMLFGADRIRSPLRRDGARGRLHWQQIAWEDADRLVLSRLREQLQRGRPERIAFLDGRLRGLGQQVGAAFLRGLGSPRYITPGAPQEDEIAAEMFSWQRAPGADLDHARVVLLFGFEGLETDGSPVWQSLRYARMRDRTIDRPVYIGVFPPF